MAILSYNDMLAIDEDRNDEDRQDCSTIHHVPYACCVGFGEEYLTTKWHENVFIGFIVIHESLILSRD